MLKKTVSGYKSILCPRLGWLVKEAAFAVSFLLKLLDNNLFHYTFLYLGLFGNNLSCIYSSKKTLFLA